MKLSDLLAKITPLPWAMNEHGSVVHGDYRLRNKVALTGFALTGTSSKIASANNAYVHHAANVLPEIVKAARELTVVLALHNKKGRAEEIQVAWERTVAALDRAENVLTEKPTTPKP